MKNYLLIFITLLMFNPVFAASEILDDQGLNNSIQRTLEDEFITAVLANPTIAYDKNRNPVSWYSGGPTGNLQFEKISITYDLVSGNTASIATNQTSAGSKLICGGTSYLSNPTSNGVTQNLQTTSCTYTIGTTLSTSTTSGWQTSKAVSDTYSLSVPFVGSNSTTVSITGTVNGGSTDTTTTSETLAYTVPATTIAVPAGCKAVVTQTLFEDDESGIYTFSDTLKNGVLQFQTACCMPSTPYTAGWIDMYDILANGTIPQASMALGPTYEGQLTPDRTVYVVGKGNYIAKNFSSYNFSYYFEDVDHSVPGTCPVGKTTLEAQQKELVKLDKSSYGVKLNKDNTFTYTNVPHTVASPKKRTVVSTKGSI